MRNYELTKLQANLWLGSSRRERDLFERLLENRAQTFVEHLLIRYHVILLIRPLSIVVGLPPLLEYNAA